MISYQPFYQTLLQKGVTEYHLIFKQGVDANKHGKAITTRTLNSLCEILDCQVTDILEYIPDDEQTSSTA